MNHQEQFLQDAKAEKAITQQQLIKELKAMIKDCFVANITEEKGALQLRFLNGQKFKLTVKEL